MLNNGLPTGGLQYLFPSSYTHSGLQLELLPAVCTSCPYMLQIAVMLCFSTAFYCS